MAEEYTVVIERDEEGYCALDYRPLFVPLPIS